MGSEMCIRDRLYAHPYMYNIYIVPFVLFLGSQHLSPVNEQEPKPNVFKHQSFRIRRGPEATAASKSSRWSFGGMAKAVGTGVTAFGSGVVQGTKAVGSGVVSGTTAVATGVVEGTKAVGTGISEGTKIVGDTVVSGGKAVGSGVVQGTKAVGTGVAVVANTTKDVTLAAGNKVNIVFEHHQGCLDMSGHACWTRVTIDQIFASCQNVLNC